MRPRVAGGAGLVERDVPVAGPGGQQEQIDPAGRFDDLVVAGRVGGIGHPDLVSAADRRDDLTSREAFA
jgi:hypothetical protein